MSSVRRKNNVIVVATLFMVAGLVGFKPTGGSAQEFRWPEEPKNLKVLPAGTKGAQLGQTMRGFASALNVRCEYCHVGKGPDLTTFDFASDEKVTKRKARLMIRMVQEINHTYLTRLADLEEGSQDRVEVTCMTCHRTATKPQMLGDLLSKTVATDGVEAAITQYRTLREKYYGGFAYDFSRGTLTGLGEQLASGGNYDAALRILDLEMEMNGESASVYFTRGGIEARAGKREQAIKSYERGLELAPEDWKPFFRQRIDKLRTP